MLAAKQSFNSDKLGKFPPRRNCERSIHNCAKFIESPFARRFQFGLGFGL
jgi:hypothetical protein